MPTFVTVGRKLIAQKHIALVELFETSASARIKTERGFLSRVVLVNRDSFLSEDPPAFFVSEHGFRMLPDDNVALNPLVLYQVEEFVPSEAYHPGKPYASRVLWKALDGNENSKLLLSLPEHVVAVVAGEGLTDSLMPSSEPR